MKRHVEESSPSVFDIESLTHDSFVQLPEHGYTLAHSPELVRAVVSVTDAFARRYQADPDFPNAKFIINPFATEQHPKRVGFLFAYGKETEFPLPREWKLPEYFSVRERFMARVFKDSLERDTIDAYGYAGYVGLNESGQPEVVVVGQDDQNSRAEGDLTAEFFQNIETLDPLRFHAGIRHHTNNGYIGNVFRYDDQSRVATPSRNP